MKSMKGVLSTLMVSSMVYASGFKPTDHKLVTERLLDQQWVETASKYDLSISRKKLKFDTINSENFSSITLDEKASQFGPANRSCCSLGKDIGIKFIPFYKVNQHAQLSTISTHSYANSAGEDIGHVYTCRGGFIDFGHLRHNADYLLYFTLMFEKFYKDGGTFPLHKEGGKRWITFNKTNKRFSKKAIIKIAQRITYDTALWHEIATWYTPTGFFLYPEKNSSFTAEDNYSNILGIKIAGKILEKSGRYTELMDKYTRSVLTKMGAQNIDVMRDLVESIDNEWVRPGVKNQNDYRTLRRNMQSYGTITPWIPNKAQQYCDKPKLVNIKVPEFVKDTTGKEHRISDLYDLNILAHKKIPVKKLSCNEKENIISQENFEQAIEVIQVEMLNYYNDGGFRHNIFESYN